MSQLTQTFVKFDQAVTIGPGDTLVLADWGSGTGCDVHVRHKDGKISEIGFQHREMRRVQGSTA